LSIGKKTVLSIAFRNYIITTDIDTPDWKKRMNNLAILAVAVTILVMLLMKNLVMNF